MNILITGANRGLGLAIANYALNKGNTVIATTRQLSQELKEKQIEHPNSLHILQFDVTDEEAIIDAKEKLAEKIDAIDVIINNAGILNGRDQSIEDLNFDDCLLAFNINTLGPARIIKHFLPLLRKGKQKSIINLSSEAGSLTNAYPGDYPYGLSKVSLNMLTEKLVRELKEDQIKVMSVHPGWMHTDMGGNQAPTDPNDTAKGIYKFIVDPPQTTTGYQFFEYSGKMMDI